MGQAHTKGCVEMHGGVVSGIQSIGRYKNNKAGCREDTNRHAVTEEPTR